jgi:hypothetical protein
MPVPERIAAAMQAHIYFGRLPGHGYAAGKQPGASLVQQATPDNLFKEAVSFSLS